MFLSKPITAPAGRALRVARISRISTAHQDDRSLDEQDFLAEEELRTCYAGPVEWTEISTQGSGDLLETEAHQRLKEIITNKEVDLILLEDLGRIARRMDTHAFCELCEIHGVRLISIREQVDTVVEGWQDVAIISLWHHERSNRETSKRIKRTKRGRFMTDGPIHQVSFAYVKPEGTKYDSDVFKDPNLEEWAVGIIERLEADWEYAEVADWLNRHNVPVGPNCCRMLPEDEHRWTGVMVRRWIHNEMLHGERYHNKTETHRVDRNGKRGQRKSEPERVLVREVAHLGFISKERHERMLAKLATRNEGLGRRPKEAYGTRTRSDFPGSALTCGVCGHPFVFGMRGDSDKLACSGLRHHCCWVGNSVDMEVVDEKLRNAVFNKLMSMADAAGVLAASVRAAVLEQADNLVSEKKRLANAIADKKRQVRNVLQQTAKGNAPASLMEFLADLEREQRCLEAQLDDFERLPDEPELPSDAAILDLAQEELFSLDRTDPAYAHAMRTLLPRIELLPVRPIDADRVGSRIVYRARVEMNLLALPGIAQNVVSMPCGTYTIVVDLFDPPARIRLAPRVAELQKQGLKQREIRDEIGTHLPTVQNAASLLRKMESAGTSDPYVAITEPCDTRVNATHLNPRYKFRPLNGFPKWLD